MKYLYVFSFLYVITACSTSQKVVETSDSPEIIEEKLTLPLPAIAEEDLLFKKIELAPNLAQGKTLFETKCAQCHLLPDTNAYTKVEWMPILNSMQIQANITIQEKDLVYDYVTMNL